MSLTKNNTQKYHTKTILQVVPALVSGGVERGTLEIANKIAHSGYNSIVISSGGPLVERLTAEGSLHIDINVASKNPFTIWINAKRIASIIKDYRVDIIHARSRAPAWSCYLAARWTNITLITTFHGVYNFKYFAKKLYNSIMTRGDKVIAVSNFVKEHIIKNYDADDNKITVIHRGVDQNHFAQQNVSEEDQKRFKKKYNVPQNIPVLLLPARMTRWKGQAMLVEALNKIKHLNFYCIMAGDLGKHFSYVQEVKEQVAKYKLQSKVQLFGVEPNMRNLYAISDIVLSTSIEPEAFGRTVIEAQAMEKIVIATKIGGPIETVENGQTGFLVTPGDADDLAQKIEYAISILGTQDAKFITSCARKHVSDDFSLDRMLSKIMSTYDEV